MPIHIKANKGDVAERVIAVGDPSRASLLANLLDNVKLVNDNRGLLTYTGHFNGTRVTIVTHGIGAPSAAIVIEELISLGVKAIIRLGTVGALVKGVKLGDVIVPNGAAYNFGGIFSQYVGNKVVYPAVPDSELLLGLINQLNRDKMKPLVGPVYSSDAFYAESNIINELAARGIIGVEMECATFFILGLIRGIKTAAVLVVSNNLTEGDHGNFISQGELNTVVTGVALSTLKVLTSI